MLRHATLASLTFALLAFPATAVLAQSEEDILSRIETIHGDADGFFQLYSEMQDAVMLGDPTDLAYAVFYPMTIEVEGETYDVADEADFIDNFDLFVSEVALDTILNQDVSDLIVTSEGVGFGNGAVWVSNVCLDDACAETAWGIIAINN